MEKNQVFPEWCPLQFLPFAPEEQREGRSMAEFERAGLRSSEPASNGRLSSSIIELASTLTRYNQELAERTAEKERMGKILAEFRKHTAWQGQRKQLMRRNQERLFNESSWLESKTTEVRWQPGRRNLTTAEPHLPPSPCSPSQVRQDLVLVSNELRQLPRPRHAPLSLARVVRQCKATATKAELGKLDIEVKLEQDSCSAVQQICTQGNKALAAHAHERDRYRAEADAYSQQALKLKDRIEELAYQVNGLAAGTL
eukprot:scaffold27608_cov71-Phaeocystis_antarctica.AAC.4